MSWHRIEYNIVPSEFVSIDLPASKSIANRLLVLNFLSNDNVSIKNLSNANDTVLLHKILSKPELPTLIDCQDAGTALRFMTCLCATLPNKTFTLTGTERLLERPMQPLFDCLNLLGANVRYKQYNGKRIIVVSGAQLKSKSISISGGVSSQFISGLCLIASQIKNGLALTIKPPVLSLPYVKITLSLLNHLGIKSIMQQNTIQIPQHPIKSKTLSVESDWSSACFFYSLLIVADDINNLCLNGLSNKDIQGDRYIAQLAERLGINTHFNKNGAQLTKIETSNHTDKIDLANYPDLAVPLIVACAFKYPKITFTGLEHLKLKESNRILAIQENLEKFGIMLMEKNGCISFQKGVNSDSGKRIEIKTFNDHRIAMSFSILATLGYSVQLDNIACIGKSFPDFFNQMNKVGIRLKN